MIAKSSDIKSPKLIQFSVDKNNTKGHMEEESEW